MTVVRPRPRKLLRSRPTIGVLVGWQVYVGMLDGFIDQVFQGIIAGAAERECNLLLACGTGLPYGTGFGKPAWPLISPTVDFLPVDPWNCDGLIVLPPVGSQDRVDFISALVDTGYPVVFSGDYSKGSAVTVDNQGGITQALDHLLAHGHQRIAFIVKPSPPASRLKSVNKWPRMLGFGVADSLFGIAFATPQPNLRLDTQYKLS